jgi:predicted dehydrogenase
MDVFRVALLGTSFGKSVQSVAFRRHPGFTIVAVAGSDPERTRVAAADIGVGAEAAFTDWRRLLDTVEVDLVSVATPVDLHHPMTLAALDRGRHVLCEKPTALHRFQAAEMRDRAVAVGKVGAINHEFRFFPARACAVELVRRGDIGEPRRGEILGRYPLWPRPESRPMTWLADRSRGGGILGALGSHHTDCLRTFFGEPKSALATVRVQQPRRGPTPTDTREGVATADDACTVQYTFASGATAIVDLDATTPYRFERFEIHGSEATLRWDETGYRLWRIVSGRDPEEVDIPAEMRLEPQQGEPALVAPFSKMVDRIHRALRGETPMKPDLDDAVAVQSALDAARRSSDAGATVAVDVPAPRSLEAVTAR